jgi:hypothetical protein
MYVTIFYLLNLTCCIRTGNRLSAALEAMPEDSTVLELPYTVCYAPALSAALY